MSVELAPGVTASDYELKNLGAALAQAHTEIQAAKKDAKNKFEDYSYVDLDSSFTAAKEVLTKNNLVVMQFNSSNVEAQTVTVYTRLAHPPSGEWTLSSMELPGSGAIGKGGEIKFSQKTIGAATTYGRKYGYKTTVGISDAADDDVDKEETKNLPAPIQSRQTKAKEPAKEPVKQGEVIAALAQAHIAGVDKDRALSLLERNNFFKACYEVGANNDQIATVATALTGKTSTKLLTMGEAARVVKALENSILDASKLSPELSQLADELGGETIP